MALSRRHVLRLGGATLVVVAGGGGWRAVDQGVFSVGKGPAYEPWRTWRAATTPARRIVAAGILASNPHNSQPWIFGLTGTVIDLFADRARQIGVIDPLLREMYIGLGCAVENMVLTARAEGLSTAVHLMPDPADEAHAARLELAPATPAASELFSAIPSRHTDRGAYDSARPVSPETLDRLEALVTEPDVRVFWFREDPARARFRAVALLAAEALVADEQQSLDSHRWWRQRWSEVQRTADGTTVDVQALGFVGPIAKLLPDLPRRQNDATFVKKVREVMLPTAAAFAILAVRDRLDASQRLRCGRSWQRVHLWGTTQGLAMQPLNQMCERTDREIQLGIEPVIGKEVAALLGDDAWQAVMPFRLGYPTRRANLSPRRGLDRVIR
jgi:nitroreductase